MLEEAHGIDSTRFQLVTNHLDTKKDQHRAAFNPDAQIFFQHSL
jgi:hypothetical protein